VLIIEDNHDLVDNITEYLEKEGHFLDFAFDGIAGLHLALTSDYDVIVLDVMLPGMDGLTLCNKLRREAEKRTPVLMLTARDTVADKLSGFDAGTDDYLVKPFSLRELGARLLALARRDTPDKQTPLRISDLELNALTMTVQRAGQNIELNRICFKILAILMRAYPGVVSRQDLEEELWGDMPPLSDSLRTHMYTLRSAIDKPFDRPLLQTVHGVGYRLVDAND
jgi:DNA-binding response OmpR family regulator